MASPIKTLSRNSNYIAEVVIRPKFANSKASMANDSIKLQFYKDLT